MSGMEGMGGADGTDVGNDTSRTYNQRLARVFWYTIAGVVTFVVLLRMLKQYEMCTRLRLSRLGTAKYPTRPPNRVFKVYATATAIAREMSYPRLSVSGPFSWLTPPPLGRVLLVLVYWAVVTYMLTHKAIISDESYYERIGFRAAWVSVVQVPLVYLLASKWSFLGRLTGTSHERLNWLHRWVSRTLLATATVHGAFFLREWLRYGIFNLEMWMMPMVKYGMGAWAVLVWTFITSLAPLRRVAYKLFVIQHITAAGVLLWLLWVHVPRYARYNIELAIGVISFDLIARGLLFVYRNRPKIVRWSGLSRFGYTIELNSNGKEITVVTLKDAPFSWKPGQHVYLWCPYLGPVETHPFTIATPYNASDQRSSRDIQFVIQTHSGFSKRIHRYAEKAELESRLPSLRAFINGPYGAPPSWKAYETLILAAASTGASFTLPVLESVVGSIDTVCVRRIRFLLIARHRHHVEPYMQRLSRVTALAETSGIDLAVDIAITRDPSGENDDATTLLQSELPHPPDDTNHNEAVENEPEPMPRRSAEDEINSPSSPTSNRHQSFCHDPEGQRGPGYDPTRFPVGDAQLVPRIKFSSGRPDFVEYVRTPVEQTGGETMVTVCAGKAVVAAVANCVVRLSDERAVHKGSGAQGIYLYTEGFSL
ncbi:ferric-chelate reductase Frp1 [Elasticomyces elasticus]|nr:ferric-chelate reductase Frp1 [Elasticomyces elasticus]